MSVEQEPPSKTHNDTTFNRQIFSSVIYNHIHKLISSYPSRHRMKKQPPPLWTTTPPTCAYMTNDRKRTPLWISDTVFFQTSSSKDVVISFYNRLIHFCIYIWYGTVWNWKSILWCYSWLSKDGELTGAKWHRGTRFFCQFLGNNWLELEINYLYNLVVAETKISSQYLFHLLC